MVTYIIIGFTVLISMYALNDEVVFRKLAFAPYIIKRNTSEWFRLISHGFIHGNLGHLLFNMITLYFFGPIVEGRVMSEVEYLVFYLLGIAFSCAASYQNNKDNSSYLACGASGSISAILFVLVFYEPWSVLYISFIIPLYYILFALGYLFYSWYMSTKEDTRIAHDAHLYGALFGIAYVLLVHPESLSIFIQKIGNPPF
jgi:membrane associated rhomboid family serine protease